MTDKPRGQVVVVKEYLSGPRLGVSARSLSREIFRSHSPEEYARKLPAQSIYLAIKSAGLESSTDLLPIISDEQYKVVLDFDLWKGETFSEENFWHWLIVLDQEPGHEALEGFLAVIDKRLLGIIISRHVEVEFCEEPSETPPSNGSYTPDQGSTWLRILIPEPEAQRRLGKLLALIFDRDAELFYQLLAESGYVTTMELEESSYQDKSRRLWDEGVPDKQTSFRLNSPISMNQIKAGIASEPASSNKTILPLAFSMANISPLNEFLLEISASGREHIESELALLANAGIVHFETDISEPTEVNFLIEKIRGALNIGLEKLEGEAIGLAKQVFEKHGLQKIYQLGLAEIMPLRTIAETSSLNEADNADDPILLGLHGAAKERFPIAPKALMPDGSIEISSEEEQQLSEKRAFTHLRQLEEAKRMLRERCVQ